LAQFPQSPEFTIVYLFPPIVVLILTRMGIPVSTTFLVLTVFVTANFQSMLLKSVLGNIVAILVGLFIYRCVIANTEQRFIQSKNEQPGHYWMALQWLSTSFLWSQWLIQDLANIFIYAPSVGLNANGVRTISLAWLVGTLIWFYILHAWIFYTRGGAIQKLVSSKTNTQDIRSATIVDFLYAVILIVFKQASNVPMSTTWVFLGLLAGREIAIGWITQIRSNREVASIVSRDLGKAVIGVVVSVGLALSAPFLHDLLPHKHKGKEQIQALSE
jgi:hypothetical protein